MRSSHTVTSGSIARFADGVVARVRGTPVDLARLPDGGVAGSIFSGAAGVAFFLHEAARLRGDDRLLDRARAWSNAARAWTDRAGAADWNGSANGFIVGECGVAFVEALLSAREHDSSGVRRALERIERVSARRRGFLPEVRPTELLGGAAGCVCATIALSGRLGTEHGARALLERVRQRATTVVEAAHASRKKRSAPDRLGMAHGFAGELWALLAVLGAAHPLVRARFTELVAFSQKDIRGRVYWPCRRSSNDTSQLRTFCNGMPGQSLLFTEMARQTRSKRAMTLARHAAESTAVLVGGVPHLCCGLAGQSVVLQRYADLAGDARFTRRAHQCLARATRATESLTSRTMPLGLWQGPLGIALVAMSRAARDRSFPCIEPPDHARERVLVSGDGDRHQTSPH